LIFVVVAYLVFMNLCAFILFAWDKRAAERGNSRIPEKTLLLASALGGSLGAIFAQRRLRHKTQKQPFKTMLYAIIALQAGLLILYVMGGLQIR
jgi:uncharacterized membrane protein YsdA (DUF1294 family)